MINMSPNLNDAMPFIRDVLALAATQAVPSGATAKAAAELLRDMDQQGMVLIPGHRRASVVRPRRGRVTVDKLIDHFASLGVQVSASRQMSIHHTSAKPRMEITLSGEAEKVLDAFAALQAAEEDGEQRSTATTQECQHPRPTVLEVATDIVQTVHVGLTELGELTIDDQAELESVLSYALAIVRRHKAADVQKDDDGTLRLA